ncbi:growth hormone secretagogue receptor type 1-like [Scleropages formosus]|uniref:Growth hormone secretagogue receptor type 1 n=1 Tax=Scleropages formosus TaxID=113540 RepID=A0A0P7UJY0_SCLFO|nr:growth hormone secretagogue receptor type 1-like [Scleropages formosus]
MEPAESDNVSAWGCVGDCANGSGPEQQETLFSTPELLLVTAVCVLLLAVGLVGNTLTVLVVRLHRDLRSTTYLYLCSMAVSDILILLLMPVDLYKLWRYRPWLLGDVTCKLSQFVSEACTFSSILHITALSVERYLAVCFPLRAKVLVTHAKVKGLIGLLWAAALLSAGPVFALVGVEELEDGGGSECRCTQYALSSGLLGAMMWLSNLYFLVPLCCLSLLYGLIARKLWHRRHCAHRDRANRQTVKMLAVIVLAFVLCWLPFHVGRTLFSVSLSSSPHMYTVSQYFNLVSFVLFYLSAAINPILYNTMSSRYRLAVRGLLGLAAGGAGSRGGIHLSARPRAPPPTRQHSQSTANL